MEEMEVIGRAFWHGKGFDLTWKEEVWENRWKIGAGGGICFLAGPRPGLRLISRDVTGACLVQV